MKINVILIILCVVGAILCIVGGYPVGFALNAANVAICIYDMVCDKHNKKG